jgi:anion-transporting  ArsA/GET3 family ATPase
LRLLDLPNRFLQHLRTAPRFYLKAQSMLGLGEKPFLEIIGEWTRLSQNIIDFFRNPANVEFLLVTIPEALGVYQTRRVARELEEQHIAVRHLIVNGVIEKPDCDFHRQRMEMQKPHIETLEREFGERMTLVKLPLLPFEVKGVERLQAVEAMLFC